MASGKNMEHGGGASRQLWARAGWAPAGWSRSVAPSTHVFGRMVLRHLLGPSGWRLRAGTGQGPVGVGRGRSRKRTSRVDWECSLPRAATVEATKEKEARCTHRWGPRCSSARTPCCAGVSARCYHWLCPPSGGNPTQVDVTPPPGVPRMRQRRGCGALRTHPWCTEELPLPAGAVWGRCLVWWRLKVC